TLDVADRFQTNRVIEDFRTLVDQELAQQVHEPADLVDRPRPVLRRKRVQRQRLETELARRTGDIADRLGAGAVTFQTRLTMPLGPAPVAVHDDADVAGQRSRLLPGGVGHRRRKTRSSTLGASVATSSLIPYARRKPWGSFPDSEP